MKLSTKFSSTQLATALGGTALLALAPVHATAGDKEWATAGKVLAGAVAVDVLSNHLPDNRRDDSRERGCRIVSPQPVVVPYYGGPAANYREFAPPPPPLPETSQPQPRPAAPAGQPKLLRIADDGTCAMDGKTFAPEAMKEALAALPQDTPVTVAASRDLGFQKVVTVLDQLKRLGFPNVSLMADPPAPAAAPEAAPPPPAQPAAKTILIGPDGLCFVDGKTVAPEALKDLLAGADPATPVSIQAHKNTPYQKIVAALDALQAAGLRKLAIRAAEEPVAATPPPAVSTIPVPPAPIPAAPAGK